MKKALILIIAGVCLLQINGLSQKTQVGLVGGITFSNLNGKMGGLDIHNDGRAGMTVGMIVDAPIGKSGFNFQPGLHYVQKGAYTSKTSTTKEAVALRYAELVLNFIHYTKSSSAKLYFGLGPAIAFNLPSKKVSISDNTRSETTITFGKELTDSYRGVDFGVNGLLGSRFKCGLIASISYTYGVRNLIPIPSGDDAIRNGCAAIRLGYIFKNASK
jgi:hypothetical protein